MMKVLKICVLAVLSLLYIACDSKNSFDAMGMFESDEVLLSAESSGRIIEFVPKEGQSVQKGDVIARLDSKPLELQREKLKVQIQNAKNEKARLMRLYKANATTKKNLDDAIYACELLEKELALLDEEIARKTLLAPIDGMLLEKYAHIGELASPTKPLCKIADIRTLRLKAYFTKSDITRIKLGDRVQVLVDYNTSHKQYEGVVSFIAAKAEFTPKTIMTKDERENLVYAVKIDVANDGFLKIGSYGEVILPQGEYNE